MIGKHSENSFKFAFPSVSCSFEMWCSPELAHPLTLFISGFQDTKNTFPSTNFPSSDPSVLSRIKSQPAQLTHERVRHVNCSSLPDGCAGYAQFRSRVLSLLVSEVSEVSADASTSVYFCGPLFPQNKTQADREYT